MAICIEDFLGIEGSDETPSGGIKAQMSEELAAFVLGVQAELCMGQAVYACFDDDTWSFKMGDREDVEGRNSIVVPCGGVMVKVFVSHDLDPQIAMDAL